MSTYEKSTAAFIVAEGGVAAPTGAPADPYQALDELMAVVETLCPTWPPREVFTNEAQHLL